MEIVIRSVIVFAFLALLVRAMGKRELSEISAFELLVLMIIGDIVQQGVTQEDMSITGALLAAGTIGLLAVGSSYVSFKFPRTRGAIEGRPVIVIRDGKIEDEMLRIERLTLGEIEEAARQRGIEDLSTIRIGILESDGRFAFLTGSNDDSDEPPARKSG
jgi:uncharacterized membrane protein YcaP (DUF421 family)